MVPLEIIDPIPTETTVPIPVPLPENIPAPTKFKIDVLATPVIIVDPEETFPEKYRYVCPTLTIVLPPGIPSPITDWPGFKPVEVDIPVIVLNPARKSPVNTVPPTRVDPIPIGRAGTPTKVDPSV